MSDRPSCPHCGCLVTVAPARDGHAFAAWCNCVNVSSTDKYFRDVAYGTTEADAIAAWERLGPK